MEALLIALVVMVLGLLSNFSKSAEKPAGEGQPSAKKRLGDYAKDFYEEARKEAQSGQQTVVETAQKKARTVEKRVASSRPGRPITERQHRTDKAAKPAVSSRISEGDLTKAKLFPLDQDDVRKGIILAEVFSPPKSKR